MRPTDTLLRLGDDLVVVKTEGTIAGEDPQLYVACTAAQQIGASLNYAQVRMLRDTLDGWLQGNRFLMAGKTFDHAAAQDSMPGPGETCKVCGEDITWVGPSQSDWLHVDDKENR